MEDSISITTKEKFLFPLIFCHIPKETVEKMSHVPLPEWATSFPILLLYSDIVNPNQSPFFISSAISQKTWGHQKAHSMWFLLILLVTPNSKIKSIFLGLAIEKLTVVDNFYMSLILNSFMIQHIKKFEIYIVFCMSSHTANVYVVGKYQLFHANTVHNKFEFHCATIKLESQVINHQRVFPETAY